MKNTSLLGLILALSILSLGNVAGAHHPSDRLSSPAAPPIPDLTIEATANTTYERSIDWTIDHTVAPASWELFTGDTGISTFTVNVNKTETDGNWAVSGTISVTNTATSVVSITGVSSEISGQGTLTDACGTIISEANPINLGPGGRLGCDYSIPLPDGSDRVLTVTVTTAAGGNVLGGTGTAEINFDNPTLLTGEPGTVTITNSLLDTYGPFSGDDQFTYTKTFNCGEDAGTNEEAATINETGDADNAIVTVNCYDLTVEKDANTTFTREWDWDIVKSCNKSLGGEHIAGSSPEDPLTLAPEQVFTILYSIAVDVVGFADSDWAVSGNITVSNPHPTRDAELTNLTDVISPGGIAATVDCGGVTMVPAGGSVTCTYSTSLPDGSDRTNTATATLQNYAFAADGTATADGTTSYDGVADVTFGAPTTVLDACTVVTDPNVPNPNLGTACIDEDLPKTFSYAFDLQFFAPDDCGPGEVVNIATSTEEDTDDTTQDNCTIYVFVPCETGCTLTPGYWKTHNQSFQGGASKKADPTWQLIEPDAENSTFFLSGQTWYDVLWTPPQGNVYYNLARAYIAAYLNSINVSLPNGTDASAITAELAEALTFFETNTPAETADLKGKDRKDINALAQTLDDYNNGLIGPGHCDEDDRSSVEGLPTANTNLTVMPFTPDQLPTEEYLLEQNRPNPFRGNTTIGFRLPEANKVLLRVYNLNGQVVATLTDSHLEAGYYQLTWNVPRDVPAGIYFYRLEAGDTVLTQRMQLQR